MIISSGSLQRNTCVMKNSSSAAADQNSSIVYFVHFGFFSFFATDELIKERVGKCRQNEYAMKP